MDITFLPRAGAAIVVGGFLDLTIGSAAFLEGTVRRLAGAPAQDLPKSPFIFTPALLKAIAEDSK